MSFYITINDVSGKDITIEVSYEIYEIFEEERKAKERYRKERQRHISDEPFDEDYMLPQRLHTPSTIETLIYRSELELAQKIIATCTPTQQRRFNLNRILGYSIVDIARKENCGESAVRKSIKVVSDKLKTHVKK